MVITMKNKGFTLVEMLAAIVIIAILGAIVVINFSNIFSSTQEKVFKTYEDSMKDASVMYIVDTGNLPTSSNPICIKLSDLVKNNPSTHEVAYLDKFNNPNSSDTCVTNSFIFVEVDPNRNNTDSEGHTDNNKKFIYKVCLSCDNYTSSSCSEVTATQKRNICGLN